MDLVVIVALTGTAGFGLGFCLGYGLRAYISARRRKLWRFRHERRLPLRPAPLLAPDVERFRDEEKKPAR